MMANKKLRKFEGTCYIPGEQLMMMAKYYRGANLNLNLTLVEDEYISANDPSCWCSKLDNDDLLRWQNMKENHFMNHHGERDSFSVAQLKQSPGMRDINTDSYPLCDHPLRNQKHRSQEDGHFRQNSMTRAGPCNTRRKQKNDVRWQLTNHSDNTTKLVNFKQGTDLNSRTHKKASHIETSYEKCFKQQNYDDGEIKCAVCMKLVCAVCKNPVYGQHCKCKCPIPNAGLCNSCKQENCDVTPNENVQLEDNHTNFSNLLFLLIGSQLLCKPSGSEPVSSKCKNVSCKSLLPPASGSSLCSCQEESEEKILLCDCRSSSNFGLRKFKRRRKTKNHSSSTCCLQVSSSEFSDSTSELGCCNDCMCSEKPPKKTPPLPFKLHSTPNKENHFYDCCSPKNQQTKHHALSAPHSSEHLDKKRQTSFKPVEGVDIGSILGDKGGEPDLVYQPKYHTKLLSRLKRYCEKAQSSNFHKHRQFKIPLGFSNDISLIQEPMNSLVRNDNKGAALKKNETSYGLYSDSSPLRKDSGHNYPKNVKSLSDEATTLPKIIQSKLDEVLNKINQIKDFGQQTMGVLSNKTPTFSSNEVNGNLITDFEQYSYSNQINSLISGNNTESSCSVDLRHEQKSPLVLPIGLDRNLIRTKVNNDFFQKTLPNKKFVNVDDIGKCSHSEMVEHQGVISFTSDDHEYNSVSPNPMCPFHQTGGSNEHKNTLVTNPFPNKYVSSFENQCPVLGNNSNLKHRIQTQAGEQKLNDQLCLDNDSTQHELDGKNVVVCSEAQNVQNSKGRLLYELKNITVHKDSSEEELVVTEVGLQSNNGAGMPKPKIYNNDTVALEGERKNKILETADFSNEATRYDVNSSSCYGLISTGNRDQRCLDATNQEIRSYSWQNAKHNEQTHVQSRGQMSEAALVEIWPPLNEFEHVSAPALSEFIKELKEKTSCDVMDSLAEMVNETIEQCDVDSTSDMRAALNKQATHLEDNHRSSFFIHLNNFENHSQKLQQLSSEKIQKRPNKQKQFQNPTNSRKHQHPELSDIFDSITRVIDSGLFTDDSGEVLSSNIPQCDQLTDQNNGVKNLGVTKTHNTAKGDDQKPTINDSQRKMSNKDHCQRNNRVLVGSESIPSSNFTGSLHRSLAKQVLSPNMSKILNPKERSQRPLKRRSWLPS